MKRNLAYLISFPLIIGALASGIGCGPSPREILKENRGIEIREIQHGDAYWKFARELKEKYPEKVGNLNINDVWMAIREEYNNGKKRLVAGGDIVLPIY